MRLAAGPGGSRTQESLRRHSNSRSLADLIYLFLSFALALALFLARSLSLSFSLSPSFSRSPACPWT